VARRQGRECCGEVSWLTVGPVSSSIY
jgi:hypothetical protein